MFMSQIGNRPSPQRIPYNWLLGTWNEHYQQQLRQWKPTRSSVLISQAQKHGFRGKAHVQRATQSPGSWCRHRRDWLSPRRGGALILKCYLPPIILQGKNQGSSESSWEAITGPSGAERRTRRKCNLIYPTEPLITLRTAPTSPYYQPPYL